MILHIAAMLLAQATSAGANLYNVHCASCHGMNVQGSAQAPPLLDVDAGDVDFELQTGRMPAEHPWEQEYKRAPAFTQQQIGELVAYVMSKSRGEKSLPAVLPGEIVAGRRVYEEHCQQCHGATGHGDSVGYRNVAPELTDERSLQIAEAVRMGPDVMPQFGPGVIDDRQLGDLIAYVQYLQHGQYNPGGLALSNLGPVSEGFIAWTIGIGLLVLFVRRIGSTE